MHSNNKAIIGIEEKEETKNIRWLRWFFTFAANLVSIPTSLKFVKAYSDNFMTKGGNIETLSGTCWFSLICNRNLARAIHVTQLASDTSLRDAFFTYKTASIYVRIL